jgi:hypothetical protein
MGLQSLCDAAGLRPLSQPAAVQMSGSDGLRRPVWQDRRADRALDAGADAHRSVFYLFEEVGFATWSAKPEVFHAAGGPRAVSRYRTCDVEDINSPLPKIMEWLAALWIRAVVHHWGPSPESRRVPCSAVLVSERTAMRAETECAHDVLQAVRYMVRMLPNRLCCL